MGSQPIAGIPSLQPGAANGVIPTNPAAADTVKPNQLNTSRLYECVYMYHSISIIITFITLSVIFQRYSLEILHHSCMGIESGSLRGQKVRYIHSSTELS